MRLNKKDINVFIELWLESDPILWANFSDIQRKILNLRIVKERSFNEIAEKFKVDEFLVRLIFESVLIKVEKTFDKYLAEVLHQINDTIERPNTKVIATDFNQIFLN